MKRSLILLLSIFVSIVILSQEKIVTTLPQGTAVSIRILEKITSSSKTVPQCVVSADVYDENGEVVLIKKGTPVEVLMLTTKASLIAVGKLTLRPISTTAYNGRMVTFDDAQSITYEGCDDSILMSRRRVTVNAGTAFFAYTANELRFTVIK